MVADPEYTKRGSTGNGRLLVVRMGGCLVRGVQVVVGGNPIVSGGRMWTEAVAVPRMMHRCSCGTPVAVC